MELQNGQWVLVKPKEPSPEQLAIQKQMVPDVWVGQACDNNFSIEIDITGIEWFQDNKPAFNLIGTLKAKSQSNKQFQALIRSRLDDISQGRGIVSFESYVVPSRNKGGNPLDDKLDLSSYLRIFVVTDSLGKGWNGTIEGANFPACVDLSLTSKKNRETNISIVSQKEIFFSSRWNNFSPQVQVYWMKKAAEIDEVALFSLGRLYEKSGKYIQGYYSSALESYHKASQRLGDVRAYYALSRMYSSGFGTPVDAVEAKKWLDQAQAAYQPANDVCISSEVLKMFELQWNEIEQRNQVMNVFGNLFLGTDNDIGQIVIGRIEAGELINLQQPFVCKAAIQRIDASFDLGEPDYYIATGPSGETYYYDNSLAKVSSDLLSSFSNALSRIPYSDQIKIYPAKDGQFVMNERLNGKTEHIIFTPHHSGIKK